MVPQHFTIDVPDTVLADLRERLARVRWPDEVPGSGWQYGTDRTYLQELVAYWQDRYDWRLQEARLNRFRQFQVELAGVPLHFIHEPGVGPNPLPLLAMHGWPSSVWEFHQLIPLLTDPARFGADPRDAFTVFWPYYTRHHDAWPIPRGARIVVPTAYAAFPKEIVRQPRAWAERVFNLQRWTTMPSGGHFAPHEEPEALAADLRAFFRPFRA